MITPLDSLLIFTPFFIAVAVVGVFVALNWYQMKDRG